MSKWKKYQKKPVVISARVLDEPMDIYTIKGTMHANKGDYIVIGIHGERYPVQPEIFNKMYTVVG